MLDRAPGPPDGLGQRVDTWQPRAWSLPCASFPAGERITREAQLVGARVTREVYLPALDLSPTEHRLILDGTTYRITLVHEWDGFTVVGVVSA